MAAPTQRGAIRPPHARKQRHRHRDTGPAEPLARRCLVAQGQLLAPRLLLLLLPRLPCSAPATPPTALL